MQSNFDDVGDFLEHFGFANVTHGGDGPAASRDAPIVEFRMGLIEEEFEELQRAMATGTNAEVFDATLDLAWVVMALAQVLGFPWNEGWAFVQAANAAKVRAPFKDPLDVGRGGAWDVVKPEGWQPPDIAGLLERNGWPPATG